MVPGLGKESSTYLVEHAFGVDAQQLEELHELGTGGLALLGHQLRGLRLSGDDKTRDVVRREEGRVGVRGNQRRKGRDSGREGLGGLKRRRRTGQW
jgi:hypothetical protein